MTKHPLLIALMLLGTTWAQQAPIDSSRIYNPENYQHRFVPGEFIVAFKAGVQDFADAGITTSTRLRKRHNLITARRPGAQTQALRMERYLELVSSDDTSRSAMLQNIDRMRRDPNVAYVEPNYILHATTIPNDSAFSKQWNMQNTGQLGGTQGADIDATAVWNYTQGSTSVLIGIIDSGIDYLHPDLAANIWTNPGEIAGNGIDDDNNGYIDDVHGYNFANNTGDPMDDFYHGTYVAGVVAGVGNNGKGVAGVSWRSKLVALKFIDASGSGSLGAAIAAIDYANAMNIPITNNSWGGGGFSQSLKDAIDATNSAGHLFVAAAGNDTDNVDATPFYPACYTSTNIISVAATSRVDDIAHFSNYGATSVDLGAPGLDVYSTSWDADSGHTYLTSSGTSIAAPHVAGVAALLWSYKPSLTVAQVKSYILQGTDPVVALTGKTVTGGRLNAKKTLDLVVPPSFTHASRTIAAVQNTAISPDTVISTGGTINSFAISPALPTGLSMNTVTGAISGTPTVLSALTNYRIIGTGPAGADTDTVAISVTNSTPTAPTLLSPAQNALNIPLSSSLTWNASVGATSYHVQVSTNATFASGIIVNDSSLVTTTRAIGPLANNTVYYWRVNARNTSGTSAWSATRNFTTLPAIPAPPVLTTPSQNATDISLSIALTWNASAGATFYHAQLSSDSAFTSLLADDTSLATPTLSVGSLVNGTAYFWRVNARNVAGTSAWSATWSFTTAYLAPALPILISPANNAMYVSTSPMLAWSAPAGATSYRLQFAGDSAFDLAVLNDTVITDTSFAVGPLVNNTTYFWRVSARNSDGSSGFSESSKFTVTPLPPSAPTLLSPEQNATDAPLSLNLTWAPVPTAADYRLQLATTETFGSSVILDYDDVPTVRPVGPLQYNTTYYWRVYAWNPAGTGPWSNTGQFTTLLLTTSIVPRGFAVESPSDVNGMLRFSVPITSRIVIRILDSRGKTELSVDKNYEAGVYVLPISTQLRSSGRFIDFRSGSFHKTLVLR